EAGDAAACGVAVGVWLGRDLAELVDDVLWRNSVGIAHAEVDDVLAPRACRRLHRVDFGEDVGRQALDAVEFLGHRGVMATGSQSGKARGPEVRITRAR